MLNYDKDPNLLFAVPMEEIVLKRNSYEHKKLHHYISERDYNDNIKDINHLIIDEYFKVYGLTNRLLFPIVKYFIIIIIIASIVSLYLTIIEKLTYINYILFATIFGLFLFCLIYVYRKEITHMKVEQYYISPIVQKKLDELNLKSNTRIKWVYDPYRIKVYILKKDVSKLK